MQTFLVLDKQGFKEVAAAGREIQLSELQSCIGKSYIETANYSELLYSKNHINCYVDDAGKLKGLQPTLAIYDTKYNEIVDFLVGPIIFTGIEQNVYGEIMDVVLNEEQISVIKQAISKTYDDIFLLFI